MKSKTTLLLRSILFGLVFLFCFMNVKAATYYVHNTGSDENTGTSTEQAFLTLHKAMEAVYEYGEDTIKLLSFIYVDSTLYINKSVTIEGDGHQILQSVVNTQVQYLISISGIGSAVNLNNIDFWTHDIPGIGILGCDAVDVFISGCKFTRGNSLDEKDAIFGDDSYYYLDISYSFFKNAPISVLNANIYNNTFLQGSSAIFLNDGTMSDIYNNIFQNYDFAVESIYDKPVSYSGFYLVLDSAFYSPDLYNFYENPKFLNETIYQPTNSAFLNSGFGNNYVGAVLPVSSDTSCNITVIGYSENSLTASIFFYTSNISENSIQLNIKDELGNLKETAFINYSKSHDTIYNFTTGGEKKFYIESIGNSCHSYDSTSFYVMSAITADFDVTVDSITNQLSLINKSIGAYSYLWEIINDDYFFFSESKDTSVILPTAGYYTIWLFAYDENGYPVSKDTVIAVGDVGNLIIADFDYSTEDGINFSFMDNSIGNIESYNWTFGDGSIGKGANVTHMYTTSGYYEVCLTVRNATNVDQYCDYFWAGNEFQCTISAGFNYRKSETGSSVTLTNTSTGAYDYAYWDFGDGYIYEGIDKEFTYTYEVAGYYDIYLFVYESTSTCYSEASVQVKIGELDCFAEFNYSVDPATLTVDLQSTSKAAPSNQYWYFDDGDYAETSNTSKQFEEGGMHMVGLIVWSDDFSCVDYIEKDIQVGEINCSAKFTFTVNATTKTVNCKNQAIGANVEYLWYFSDGTYKYEKNPSHTFKANGYYSIGLVTYDITNWCMDYYEDIAIIGDPDNDCEAMFTQTVNNENKTVRFADQSKGKPVSYLWDFGDGKGITSSLKSPEYTYNKGGYYNVCLSITNQKGIPNISCKKIAVGVSQASNCKADFVFSMKDKNAYFTDKSIGKGIKYSWDFGNNKTSTDPNPTHLYDSAGYYMVKLSIKTDSGCISSTYNLVNINMPDTFIVRFGYDEKDYDRKAGGYPVDFVGAGSGDQARLRWEFGDDSTNTTSTTPTHVYAEPGIYNVCVTYADPVTGDSATFCQEVSTSPTYIPPVNDIASYLLVYPNPVVEELNLNYKLENSGNIEISLYDIAGKKLRVLENASQMAGDKKARFNLKDMAPGTYVLQISTKNGAMKKMIVKK